VLFSFYGRVSTEDHQDPESSRGWQLRLARGLIEPHDGRIVVEFFDIGESRSLPWQRRPQAQALLAALKRPDRGFDAVVIGEPHRAFYGNQFGLTFPLFAHYGVQLWVPEVGGPLDPDNEAHDLVMSVFGGMSKGERNRIKVRVRTAMASQMRLKVDTWAAVRPMGTGWLTPDHTPLRRRRLRDAGSIGWSWNRPRRRLLSASSQSSWAGRAYTSSPKVLTVMAYRARRHPTPPVTRTAPACRGPRAPFA
jgi:DNA invertase Pin-like site-specific DNA recombinase